MSAHRQRQRQQLAQLGYPSQRVLQEAQAQRVQLG